MRKAPQTGYVACSIAATPAWRESRLQSRLTMPLKPHTIETPSASAADRHSPRDRRRAHKGREANHAGAGTVNMEHYVAEHRGGINATMMKAMLLPVGQRPIHAFVTNAAAVSISHGGPSDCRTIKPVIQEAILTNRKDPWTDSSFEQAVRETAYFLWEQDGRPDGREKDYWFRALETHLRER